MTVAESLVLLSSAALGAISGVLFQRSIGKARPVVFVKSCELSSNLLSRVDYLSMPENIAVKFEHFPWKLVDEPDFIPDETTIIPVGFAQEQLYLLKELIPRLDTAIELVDDAKDKLTSTDDEGKKQAVYQVLTNSLALRALQGKIRRQTFSVLKSLPPNVDFTQPTYFPWAVDDAGGVGEGTLGAYTIHLGTSRVNFPFRWPDERERMKIISYLFAACDQKHLPQLLSELYTELTHDRQIAVDLQNWFTANIDLYSTLLISASISNMGKLPMLISQSAALVIALPDKPPIRIECQSETFSDDTEEARATKRIVKVLKRISQIVDVAIPIRTRVPSERLLLSGAESKTITFRSQKTFAEMQNGKQLLHLYHSREINAQLELRYEVDDGSDRVVESSKFVFGSSISIRKEESVSHRSRK